MSILFVDAQSRTRPRGRSTAGLWLSVVLHAIVVVVLIVDPIRAAEKPAPPRMQSRTVFIFSRSGPDSCRGSSSLTSVTTWRPTAR